MPLGLISCGRCKPLLPIGFGYRAKWLGKCFSKRREEGRLTIFDIPPPGNLTLDRCKTIEAEMLKACAEVAASHDLVV